MESTPESNRVLERLRQNDGSDVEVAIALARRAALHEDFTTATRIVEQARLAAPHAAQARLWEELFRIAQWRQDLPRMRSLLQAELQQHPNDVGLLCRLAELDQREEKWKDLQSWEEQLVKAGPLGELWARYFRIVRLYSLATRPDDPLLIRALSEQAQLATLRPNWAESFALRGAIEQRMQHLEAAVAAYEQAVELGDNRYAVFEQLIACLEQVPDGASRIDKYLARLEGYLPSSQRLTEIASRRQFFDAQPRRAVEIARRAAEQRPNDLGARLWLGRMLLAAEQRSEALCRLRANDQGRSHGRPDVAWSVRLLHAEWRQKECGPDPAVAGRERSPGAGGSGVDPRPRLEQAERRAAGDCSIWKRRWPWPRTAPTCTLNWLGFAPRKTAIERCGPCRPRSNSTPTLAPARHMLAAILAAGGSDAELAEAERLLSGSQAGPAASRLEDRRVQAILFAQHGGDSGMKRAIEILSQIERDGSASKNDRLLLAQFLERSAAATPDPDEAAGDSEEGPRAARKAGPGIERQTCGPGGTGELSPAARRQARGRHVAERARKASPPADVG